MDWARVLLHSNDQPVTKCICVHQIDQFQRAHALWCNQIKIFQFQPWFMHRFVNSFLVGLMFSSGWHIKSTRFAVSLSRSLAFCALCVHMTVLTHVYISLLCLLLTLFFTSSECSVTKEGYFLLRRSLWRYSNGCAYRIRCAFNAR